MKKVKSKGAVPAALLSVVIMAIFFFILSAGNSSARPFRMGKIPDPKLGCGVCHLNPGGGGSRNDFGKDYAKIGIKAGERYTDELAAKDSDGDGYTNAQEFEAGTNPGDKNSKPAQ